MYLLPQQSPTPEAESSRIGHGGRTTSPSRAGRPERTKDEPTHTTMKSSGTSRGAHPYRMTIHTDGEFYFTLMISETPLPSERCQVLKSMKRPSTRQPTENFLKLDDVRPHLIQSFFISFFGGEWGHIIKHS